MNELELILSDLVHIMFENKFIGAKKAMLLHERVFKLSKDRNKEVTHG